MIFKIEKRNVPRAWLVDNYYKLIRLPWLYLGLTAFGFYILINLFFGAIYFVLRDGLHPPNLDYANCFFFSVQTFSTVGYGTISPASFAVHIITVVETFLGL